MQLLVQQSRWEANGVVSLTLVDPDGAELPEWEPGAHLELSLPVGASRHYSLCGNPDDRYQYKVAVLKQPAGRGGSRYIHEELRVGDHLDVRTVRNNFRFTPTPRIQFVAGGIGITPLLPMIREAQRQCLDWRLWYGGRCRTAMAFLAELGEIDPTRLHIFPADERGLIDLDTALGEPAQDTSIYCCGPESLLAAAEEHCAKWPPGALHLERFAAPKAAPAPKTTTASQASVTTGDGTNSADGSGGADSAGGVEVVAQVSGVEVHVPAGKSILDALEEANVAASSSCREGICGSCEVKVLEGTPEHNDLILTDEEKKAGNTMMICVSRSRTPRLVLDL